MFSSHMHVQSITGFRTTYCTTREGKTRWHFFYASILVQVVVFDLNINSHHTFFSTPIPKDTHSWELLEDYQTPSVTGMAPWPLWNIRAWGCKENGGKTPVRNLCRAGLEPRPWWLHWATPTTKPLPRSPSDRFWKTREELFLVLELREKKFTFAIHKGGKMKIFLFICRPFFWAQHRTMEGDSFGSRAQ